MGGWVCWRCVGDGRVDSWLCVGDGRVGMLEVCW